MHTRTLKNCAPHQPCKQQESRSARFNVPVRHPSKWALLFERLLASPLRLHRYRVMSAHMLEDTIERIEGEKCQ